MINHPGSDVFSDAELIKYKYDKDTRDGITEVTKEAYKALVRERNTAVGLIKRRNQKKIGELMVNIIEQYSFDIDVYLESISSAYELIENHNGSKIKREDCRNRDTARGCSRNERGHRGRERRDTVTEIKYAYDSDVVPGSDCRTKLKITCFRYEKKRYFVDFCTEIEAGQQHAEVREQQHMDAITITDRVESESNDKSIIMSFQYV